MKAFLAICAFLGALYAYEAHAASLNATSYMNYSATNVGTTDWVALPGQPSRTFAVISVRDSSGSVMELGSGKSPNISRQMLIGGGTGASTQTVVYPRGLSYQGSTSSVWIRAVSAPALSGESVINFFY